MALIDSKQKKIGPHGFDFAINMDKIRYLQWREIGAGEEMV